MLDPGWIDDHADTFDVFHVHFGFDAMTPTNLDVVLRSLRRRKKPLVYTVHDLRNPHHDGPSAHDSQLDALIPQADGLITLTRGAARVVEHRWGRRPHVLPHPHVLEFDQLVPRATHDPAAFVVGVHCKSARASMAPEPVIRALAPLISELPGLKLRIDVHRDVFDLGGARHDRALRRFLVGLEADGIADVAVHDFYTDDELWSYLRSLDVSVLPYRFGTHSGWLEACFDLGTTVIAPTCGFFYQQRPCLSYRHDESGLDASSLRKAVRVAYARRPYWQATAAGRREERTDVAAAHRRIYERVLS